VIAQANDPGAVERLIASEREARATAEREAAAQKARADELAKASETEADRLKREAEEGRNLGAQGAAALQQANKLVGLTSLGLTGPAAAAALKLVDGVEFDSMHRPTNLQARLDAAKQIYGEGPFTGATPVPVPTPDPTDPAAIAAAAAGPAPGVPVIPEMHQGPRVPAGPSDAEKEAAWLSSFPQAPPVPT
jgi:hypothetical protein